MGLRSVWIYPNDLMLNRHRPISPIKWKIIKKSSTADNFNSRCNLCIEENIFINFKDTW